MNLSKIAFGHQAWALLPQGAAGHGGGVAAERHAGGPRLDGRAAAAPRAKCPLQDVTVSRGDIICRRLIPETGLVARSSEKAACRHETAGVRGSATCGASGLESSCGSRNSPRHAPRCGRRLQLEIVTT